MKILKLILVLALYAKTFCFSQWVLQQSNTNFHLFGVFMIDANTGFVAGDYQTVRKTTDGGANWIIISNVPNLDYGNISFLNANTGIIAAGPGARMIQTYDGGLTWINRFPAGYPVKVQYIDSNIIYGTGGYWVMKSTNGGINWFQIDTSSYSGMFNGIYFVNKDTGTVVGLHALIKTTTDGGLSWTQRIAGIYPPKTDSTLGCVMYVNTKTGYACGIGGIVIKTTNGGINWNYKPSGSNSSLPALFFTDTNNGTVVGYPYIGRTTNGGDNWISQSYPTNDPLRNVYFVSRDTGWIVGFNGTILYTSNGGWTWIKKNSSDIPSSFNLYQNYPNPFNLSTNIKYQIAKSSFVKLVIYDVLGKKIKILVNGIQSTGSYEVRLNSSDYASGVYYYQLTAHPENSGESSKGEFNETKKMVLVK